MLHSTKILGNSTTEKLLNNEETSEKRFVTSDHKLNDKEDINLMLQNS